MSKVDFPEGSTPFFNPAAYTGTRTEARKAKEKPLRGVRKPAFSTFLDQASVGAGSEIGILPDLPVSEETLRTLLDDIHAAGEELKEKSLNEQIKRYKTAVRNFLHYVVENGYNVQEQTSGTNILKRKKFTLVQVIDKKLEQLAAGILAGQSTQLDLLARLDEISGLLVNLLR